MYSDTKPCEVCGSAVELRARTPDEVDPTSGPPQGYVGDGDSPVDERVCTNTSCSTHQG